MQNESTTNLDILGMELATKEKLGIKPDRILRANISSLESLGDLIKRDQDRERDGFPKKIRFRKVLVAPGRIINVPYAEEGQLIHGDFEPTIIQQMIQSGFDIPVVDDDIGEVIGHGEGEVGDVIGEMPMSGRGGGSGDEGDGDADGPGPGAGNESEDHGFEEEAYETGKKLTEKLQLPNLKDKFKKVPTDEYKYDLTDRHRGSGQVLDNKETLKRIVRTNLLLDRINIDDLDPTKMIIWPEDRVFRVLSRERVWKAQAVVFFARDFSGSMWGPPTASLVSLHLLIYAWLLVQFEKRVIPRFIVHDTRAEEVTAKQYFTLDSGGGTVIASAYKKINEIVEGENLESKYNIYIFQGTDGDDFESDGRLALPEMQKILRYVNRMGVCLFKHPHFGDRKTNFEQYLENAGILEMRDIFRMHIMPLRDITEEMNIEALKVMTAQD